MPESHEAAQTTPDAAVAAGAPRKPEARATRAARRRGGGIVIPLVVGVLALALGGAWGAQVLGDSAVDTRRSAVPEPKRAPASQVVAVIGVGANAQNVAIDEVAGIAYVTRLGAPAPAVATDQPDPARNGSVTVIDTASRQVVRTIPVGVDPVGVAVDATGGLAWVANSGDNSVSVVSAASRTAVGRVEVGQKPRYLATDPATGLVYVANTDEDSLSVIDGRSRFVVDMMGVPARPLGVAYNPADRQVYITQSEGGQVDVIDPTSPQSTFKVGERPFGVGIDTGLGSVYVSNWGSNTVTVVEAKTHRWWDTITVGNRPFGVAVDADARAIYVTNWESNSVSVIDANTRAVVNTIAVGARPQGVAVDPRDGTVYVVNSGEGNVSVLGRAA